ncbi:MAG: DUF116 domain-containing protein [bacterium]
MDAITYSLKIEQSNSDAYYNTARNFTNEVVAQSADTLVPLVSEYIEYLKSYQLEEVREVEEYILELISFGILWKTYADKALAVKRAPFVTMSRMGEWRKKHQKIKPAIDAARGVLITLVLLPERNGKQHIQIPILEQVDHFCKWMEATGEFREQAIRFVFWRAYWGMKDAAFMKKIFITINNFISWFDIRSNEVLGKYTENVNDFLECSQNKYRWREDRVSCTRSRLEYHLNMVGAELMNRAFRKDFRKTNLNVVLLPGCMRINSNEECKAKRVKEGLICTGCTPQCRVNGLREMGKKNDFDVYVIPHASDLTLWAPRKDSPVRGVIASACVTTLVEGGWELKRYGVPAQCVLLDYSGCRKHWCAEGIPTSLNINELKRILVREAAN